MKKTTLLLGILIAFFALATQPVVAQQKVKEKDILGTWKMVIDIDEAMEEAERDLEEEDNWLGRAIVQSVSGLVGGIVDNIEIYFDFEKGGELKIYVEAFGEGEAEYSEWEIKDGQLYIYEDSDNVSFGDEDYWMLDGKNKLVSFEEGRYDDEMEENVYLIRID